MGCGSEMSSESGHPMHHSPMVVYLTLGDASGSHPVYAGLLIKANRRNDVYITQSSVKQIQLHIKKIQQL